MEFSTNDIREMILGLFDLETNAAKQEYDCCLRNNHQEAAACHAKRREYLRRAGALMEAA